jgi:hypothetical protein
MKPSTLTNPLSNLSKLAGVLLAIILVLVPFHAFLTIIVSNVTGGYDWLRLWEECLLLLVSPVVLLVIWKDQALWRQLQKGWLLWAIICYVLLTVGLGLVAFQKGQVNSYALLYAWIINLRPMVMFVCCWALGARSPWLHRYWKRLLLWPALLVVSFGLLQATVLPYDYLKHFGYGPATIAAYDTVDEKIDYVRIQSTLRGSNPLGAYLVIVMAALLVLVRRSRSSNRYNAGLLVAFLVAMLVLFNTYSRSAYIGLVIAIVASIILAVRNRQERRWLTISLLVVALVAGGLFAVFRTNDQLENTLFHTNEDSRSSVSSNAQRLSAVGDGFAELITEPFGRGPGTAGPASIHNSQPARIAENYYVQIGQETGWLGLGLFVAIVLMIAKRLWHRRNEPLARILLISLAGISFINLVQHAWTDDTLSLLWWGLAGIAISTIAQPAILKDKNKENEKPYIKSKQSRSGKKASTATL